MSIPLTFVLILFLLTGNPAVVRADAKSASAPILESGGPTAAALEWAGDQAAEEGRTDEAIAFWQASYQKDPSRWSPAQHLAAAQIIRSPLVGLAWAIRALEAGWGSFRHQYTLVVNILLLLVESLLLATLIMGLLWIVRIVPLIHHGLLEMMKRFLPVAFASVAAGLVLALPLMANLGFWVTIAIPIILGAWLFRRPSPRGSILLGVGSFLSPVVLLLLARLTAPADPVHPLTLVDQIQRDAGYPRWSLVLNESLKTRPGDPLLRFARSISAWESGDLKTAEADLTFLEARGGIDRAKILANRAGVTLSGGDSEGAISQLWAARRIKQDQAEVAYNLALAYVNTFQMDKADREFRFAQDLDPGRIQEADRQRLLQGETQPMREQLGNAELWAAAFKVSWPFQRFPIPMPLALLYPAGNPWLLWPALLFAGLAVLLLGRRLRGLRLRSCSRCGRSICRRCVVRVGYRGLCGSCAAMVRARGRGWDRKLALRRYYPGGPMERGRWAPLTPILAGFIIPGGPQVVQERELRGFFYIAAASLSAFLLIHGGLPFPGLGGGDLVVFKNNAVGLSPFWPILGYLILGLSSAREAVLNQKRQRDVAVWIGTEGKKAA
ncbi:MAG: hypothetical protein KJ831_13640 [Candidatus Eisenbacteria bacterium]|nr:hypothetical protein [Candidatus Eisenbacteria bacterium]